MFAAFLKNENTQFKLFRKFAKTKAYPIIERFNIQVL